MSSALADGPGMEFRVVDVPGSPRNGEEKEEEEKEGQEAKP